MEALILAPIAVWMILLAHGIAWAFRRSKCSRLEAGDFPGVPGDRFEQWRRVELRSIEISLWVTSGLLLVGVILAIFVLGPDVFLSLVAPRQFSWALAIIYGSAIAVVFPYFLLCLLGLTISAMYGSKAKRLKKSLGIQWPGKA